MTAVITIGAEPARIDIDVRAGEPVDFTVPVPGSAGAPRDVSGSITAAQVRAAAGASLLHTFAASAGPAGVRVTATGPATASWGDWPVPVARWDLWVIPPGEPPDLIAAGWVRVYRSVTPPPPVEGPADLYPELYAYVY